MEESTICNSPYPPPRQARTCTDSSRDLVSQRGRRWQVPAGHGPLHWDGQCGPGQHEADQAGEGCAGSDRGRMLSLRELWVIAEAD